MIAGAMIFAALAALLHVYIFVMESITWTTPRTRAVFGTTVEEAQSTRMLAFNQGFYNLFLAVVTAVGVGMLAMGHRSVGAALILAGAGSMLAAALVLVSSSPDKVRAAFIQGFFPLITIVALTVALL